MDTAGYCLLWAIICAIVAKSQNRNVAWGVIWGLLFGFIAFLVYLIIGTKDIE